MLCGGGGVEKEKRRRKKERERAGDSEIGLIKRRNDETTTTLSQPRPPPPFLQLPLQDGTPIPVRITAYADKSYDYTMKTPPASHLLKAAAGVAKGAQKPGHASSSVGSVSAATVLEIARVKAADLPPHVPLRSVAKSVAATARSMGVKVVGEV
jgi:ribosomal protein L11